MTQPAVPESKLQVLRRAAADTAATLLKDVGDDDVAAINCVLALEDALRDLNGLLGLVPSLLEIAALGSRVEERVIARRDEVERQRAELTVERAALEADRELSRQLDEIKAEKDQIAAKIAELQRVKLIMGELPALRATVRTLEETVTTAQESDASQITVDLTAAVGAISGLSKHQGSAVSEELSGTAQELEAATKQTAQQRQQLAQMKDQLAGQIAEARELKAAADNELPAIQLYLQADADLLSGLEAAEIGNGGTRVSRVKESLAEITQRLADLDTKLKPLLIAHARAYEQALQVRR
jgi:hypothetical protein